MSDVSREACRKALKTLKEYTRLYEQPGRLMPAGLKAVLDNKRDNGDITSHDLPGSLRRDFPGELASLSLREIQDLCSGKRK